MPYIRIGRTIRAVYPEGKKPVLVPPKTLTIVFDDGKAPEVQFTGFWTGKDINSLPRIIQRAYRIHKANIRKELRNG